MKKMNSIIAVSTLLVIGVFAFIMFSSENNSKKITNFEECVAAGHPVMESYPRQCSNGDMIFREELDTGSNQVVERDVDAEEAALLEVTDEAHYDLIRVYAPLTGETIVSPVTIRGIARGPWFFEASFPIEITNWDGAIIGRGIATSKEEWTTEDFIPFEALVEFDAKQENNQGTIILKKDNPSGLEENEDALKISILLGTEDSTTEDEPTDSTETESDVDDDTVSDATTNDEQTPDVEKPPIVDFFACGDNCPGPQEQYMVKVYEGVKDMDECVRIGGTPSSFIGWGTTYYCLAEPAGATQTGLSEEEARLIAEDTCIKGGESLSTGIYNEYTKTWWFDANLNATKEGCNPACVVSESTKTAEINWRCIGLRP